jgi:hypothetical protein
MAKVRPPRRPKMFGEGVTTVKPEAAQRATALRDKAKDIVGSYPKEAATLVRRSNEALADVETPRRVIANRSRRSTGPSEMKQVAKVAAGSVDSKP